MVKPLPLVKDGDLVALVQYMIQARGRETVRVTEVQGHADDADAQQGRVRLEDQLANAEADAAADLSRRHQSELLIDARHFHRFIIAVAGVTVNHDGRGGTAPDPPIWDQGVGLRFENCRLEKMLILHLFLALLSFFIILGFRLMLVPLLVLTFLLGPIVLVFWLGSLPFLVLCIGQWF